MHSTAHLLSLAARASNQIPVPQVWAISLSHHTSVPGQALNHAPEGSTAHEKTDHRIHDETRTRSL